MLASSEISPSGIVPLSLCGSEKASEYVVQGRPSGVEKALTFLY